VLVTGLSRRCAPGGDGGMTGTGCHHAPCAPSRLSVCLHRARCAPSRLSVCTVHRALLRVRGGDVLASTRAHSGASLHCRCSQVLAAAQMLGAFHHPVAPLGSFPTGATASMPLPVLQQVVGACPALELTATQAQETKLHDARRSAAPRPAAGPNPWGSSRDDVWSPIWQPLIGSSFRFHDGSSREQCSGCGS
jgi:hypothetical protein